MTALEKLPASELEEWRHHPITQALLRALETQHRFEVDNCASAAALENVEQLRRRNGRIHALADTIELIRTKGTSDDE